jgi:hypothetical protein
LSSRYAIYHIPAASSEMYLRVSNWLGYSIHDAAAVTQDHLTAPLSDFRSFTRHARRYGCHATFKPPFRLKPSLKEKHLRKIFKHFCRIYPPIRCPGLGIESIGRFLALTPTTACAQVRELATDCIQTFDLFRDEMSPAEFNKRRPENLSANQLAMLKTWGYPYVLDEFRLHITLTDPLPDSSLMPCKNALHDYLLPAFGDSYRLDSLSLCYQPDPTTPFSILDTHLLGDRVKS